MAYKCTDAESIYVDLPFCRGKKSLPGLRGKVYGISKRDIVSYPTIAQKPAKLADFVTYTGDFKLAADKKWHQVGLIPDQSQLQSESQGSYGSKTFKNTLKVLIPGTEEDATGYICEANNDEMIYLAVQRNGKARVLGSDAFTPMLTLSQDSGQSATDTNATTIQIEVTDICPAPFYPGKIETADGNISGATGIAVAAAPAVSHD